MMDRNMRGRGMKFGGNVKRYAKGGGVQEPKPPKSSQPPRPKYGINPPPLPPKKEKKPPKKPDPKNIQPPKVKPEPPKQKYKPMPVKPPKSALKKVANPPWGKKPSDTPVGPPRPVRPRDPRALAGRQAAMNERGLTGQRRNLARQIAMNERRGLAGSPGRQPAPQAATQVPAKGRGVLGGLGDMLKKPTPPPRDSRALAGRQAARQVSRPMPRGAMRSGGKVHKYAEGGSVYRKGADGIATKGKTRGMTVRMRKGGMC